MFVIVFTLEKFYPYLLSVKINVFVGHSTIKHLWKKNDLKSRLIRWVLLLQGFQ